MFYLHYNEFLILIFIPTNNLIKIRIERKTEQKMGRLISVIDINMNKEIIYQFFY